MKLTPRRNCVRHFDHNAEPQSQESGYQAIIQNIKTEWIIRTTSQKKHYKNSFCFPFSLWQHRTVQKKVCCPQFPDISTATLFNMVGAGLGESFQSVIMSFIYETFS